MKQRQRLANFFRRKRHFWITLILVLGNGLAWNAAFGTNLPEPDPILAPEITEIRDKWRSGEASGETFSVIVTDQMGAEAIAWFLERYPEIPFSHPQVEFTPDGVTGRGLAHLLGVKTPVFGRVSVRLEDQVPKASLEEIGVASATAPSFMVDVLRNEIDRQQQRFKVGELPIVITKIEFREGEVLVEGIYR
jgi:hypothetical protein